MCFFIVLKNKLRYELTKMLHLCHFGFEEIIICLNQELFIFTKSNKTCKLNQTARLVV